MTLADRVVVMNAGLIEQVGTPNDLYHSPATKFVAGFHRLAAMNFIPCQLDRPPARCALRLGDKLAFRCPRAAPRATSPNVGKPNLVLGLRPSTSWRQGRTSEPNQHDFDQMIDVVEPMGMETLVYSPCRASRSAAGSIRTPAPSRCSR